jgi:hypothetical protein
MLMLPGCLFVAVHIDEYWLHFDDYWLPVLWLHMLMITGCLCLLHNEEGRFANHRNDELILFQFNSGDGERSGGRETPTTVTMRSLCCLARLFTQ